MTSAVLAAGRNEVHHPHSRHWGGARVPHLAPKPSPSPSNPNNPRRHRAANPIPGGPPTPPRAVPAAPDPAEPSSSGRVTFRPSEMTPAEARQLRARLAGELGRVRALLSRVGAWPPPDDGGHHQRRRRRAAGPPGRPEDEPPALAEAERAMLRRCAEILTRLRKSKHSVWFNSPVDVEGLRLHDYHAVIRRPMDLGTVKRNLAAGRYPSHEAFAGDVRLTFSNAARYNPPDHHVHRYAGSLLATFEGLYGEAVAWFEQQQQRRQPMPPDLSPPLPQPVVSVPVQAPPPPRTVGPAAGTRRPKPKAREPNKRGMDEAEKQRLRVEVESLPEEKMVNVLQIVQKRNSDPALAGEVVELDFDELDAETLWELDRFVANWRKALKRTQQRSSMTAMNGDAAAAAAAVVNGDAIDVTVVVPEEDDGMVQVDVNPPPMMVETGDSETDTPETKRAAEPDTADEYVDIGDEMPTVNYQSVEIERDAQVASSSSGSGSGSSSSSDSDSDSESDDGDDDDDDDARSPD